MSWWDTGQDDDVTGDQPADIARQALERIVVARAKRFQEPPTLADLLQAFVIVATSAGGKVLADRPEKMPKIVADLKSGESVSSSLRHTDAEAGDVVESLTQSLSDISSVYQERWERKPRLSEWLQAFEFVLRYRPEDYLLDGAAHLPVKIKVMTC